MTLTFSQLLSIQAPLSKLVKLPLGARCAFRIGHTAKLLAPHMEAVHETRLRLYRQYGNEDGQGNITVPDARLEEFRREIGSLMGERVSVNIKPLKLEELAEVDALTAEDLMALGPLIVE